MKILRRFCSFLFVLLMLAGLLPAFGEEKGSFRFEPFSGGAMGMEFISLKLDENADIVSLWPNDTVTTVVLEVLDAENEKLVAHIIWTADQMESNQVINLQANMGESFPRFRIRCINSRQETESYYLEESAENGEMLLTEASAIEPLFEVVYEGWEDTLDQVVELSDQIAEGDPEAESALAQVWEKQRLALWGDYAQSEAEKNWLALRQEQTEPLAAAKMTKNHVYELKGEGIMKANPVAEQAESGTLSALLDAAAKLFFETDNVTVAGTADFSLDGVLFKKASVTHIQNDHKAYREVVMQTPQKNGSFTESGYTIWVDGSSACAAESCTNGSIRDYSPLSAPRTAILEYSLPVTALLPVLRLALNDAEGEFEITAVNTEEGGRQINVQCGDNLPSALNAGLNLGMQYLLGKLYGINFAHSAAQVNTDYAGIEAYGTISDGIRYCTRSVALENCDFTVNMDEQGRPTEIAGRLDVKLNLINGDSHLLSVSFEGGAGSYGNSITNRWQTEK